MEKLMNRRYPHQPMVGVGAIIFREDQVLLVQRGGEPAKGKWSLPGGLVELGESLHDAVRREVMEEVGLAVKVLDLVVALDRVIFDDKGKIQYHYVLLDFFCEADHDKMPIPASDAMDCRFVPLQNLSAMNLTDGTAQVIHRSFNKKRGQPHSVYDPSL
jgi:8-oxo-dGTP diphosphatase